MTKAAWYLAHATPSDSEPFMQRQIERRLTDQAILRVLGFSLPWWGDTDATGSRLPQDQELGEACQGRLINQCRGFFEDSLAIACRSCPGPSAEKGASPWKSEPDRLSR